MLTKPFCSTKHCPSSCDGHFTPMEHLFGSSASIHSAAPALTAPLRSSKYKCGSRCAHRSPSPTTGTTARSNCRSPCAQTRSNTSPSTQTRRAAAQTAACTRLLTHDCGMTASPADLPTDTPRELRAHLTIRFSKKKSDVFSLHTYTPFPEPPTRDGVSPAHIPRSIIYFFSRAKFEGVEHFFCHSCFSVTGPCSSAYNVSRIPDPQGKILGRATLQNRRHIADNSN
ncbi:hypothetical protein EDB83DRAFT_2401429 [Lactarius deliciosus]|nr:hypothetical protein EDB83DRAFT_2401429 [Lactarius deliciosus]